MSADALAQQVRYRNGKHQAAHHQALLDHLGPLENRSLCDIGCGFGGLIRELPATCQYLGIDVDVAAIREARRLHSHHHFLAIADPRPADFVVAAATLTDFYVPAPDLLRAMWEHARVAVAISGDLSTTSVEEMESWWEGIGEPVVRTHAGKWPPFWTASLDRRSGRL